MAQRHTTASNVHRHISTERCVLLIKAYFFSWLLRQNFILQFFYDINCKSKKIISAAWPVPIKGFHFIHLFLFSLWTKHRFSYSWHVLCCFYNLSHLGNSLIFLLAWVLYKVINKFLLTKYLSWFHVLTTIIILILLLTANVWHDKLMPPLKREYYSWETLQQDQLRERKVYLPIAIIFVVGQIAYFVNLLGGLVKRRL